MSIRRTGLLISFALLALIASAQTKQPAKKSAARTASGPMIVEPGSEKWGDIPAGVLAGASSVEVGGTLRVAILQGDPTKAGATYTLRFSCTDGAKVAPHWHPTRENVTVIKGGVAVGMGTKWDDAALKDVPLGGFFAAEAQMRHFAQCKGDTILQIHGVGPFVINFVSPE